MSVRVAPCRSSQVASVLGVSHGSVYRHFATKAALREAVTERWLDREHDELSAIVDGEAPRRTDCGAG
jgi:AcrR family transcriptional regulator